ncbi:hypothetical protein F4802DRAFT_616724 [Xylaria palmicola]|nr:hypothetical protein F4802DRAFT_616724 [Xylaria palmicola]
MLFLNVIIFALFWAMQPALCLPALSSPPHSTLNKQAPADLTWEGIPTEDGPNVKATGSLSDITLHIKKTALTLVLPEPMVPSSHSPQAQAPRLGKRSEHRLLCGDDEAPSGGYADYYAILDQAAQLQAMLGFCRAAPRSCARVTCGGGSAVSLCSRDDGDSTHDAISTCARVGQYAQEIVEWCYGGQNADVKGQVYDGDLWSVMVHADDSC